MSHPIKVTSHLHSDPAIWISVPSRSPSESSPEMCVSSSSRYQLTPSEHQVIYLTSIHFRLSSAQASKFGSHLHSSYISPPSKSLYPCVTSIQIMSHLHPSPDIHVSPPTRSRLNSIQVTWIVAQLHLCPFLPKSRSRYMRRLSFNALFHLHSGL